jgi:hypothetical protein
MPENIDLFLSQTLKTTSTISGVLPDDPGAFGGVDVTVAWPAPDRA